MKNLSWPDTRGWALAALFVTTWFILGLIAWKPDLSNNTMFVTLATLIVGSGGPSTRVIVEAAAAPKVAGGGAEFAPESSPIEEVRAYIVGHGGEIAEKTSEKQTRAQAAEMLAKSRA